MMKLEAPPPWNGTTSLITVYVNKKSPYSTVIIQVVSLSHYSSSTVVLTVIGILVN